MPLSPMLDPRRCGVGAVLWGHQRDHGPRGGGRAPPSRACASAAPPQELADPSPLLLREFWIEKGTERKGMDLGKLGSGGGVTGISSVHDFCFVSGSVWLNQIDANGATCLVGWVLLNQHLRSAYA
jgi:hypothetical protein